MATLSLSAAGLMDQNGVGKSPLDGVSQNDQDNLLTFLMEKLKMTSKQVKAWSEERLKIRNAMAVYKNTDIVDPERLQKCLENIKRAITVSSLPAMVERLESLAKPVNLKVTSTTEGNIFISSDTFYVEVVMGENGNVKDVMIAQSKDPVSCPEMCEALRENNFKEFGEHLKGLADFYQGGGDGNQKTKAFTSMQFLEKDLLTVLALSKKPGSTPLTLVKNSLGYCTPRAGGRHMRLTYFVSPYDLLDVEQKQAKELGPDDPLPKDIGLWVSLGVETSPPRKLQTMPLIVTTTTDGKLAHVNTAIGPTNSIALPAVFTLTLSQPMPVSVMLIKQLQNYGVTMVYSEPATALPINTLICRHTLDPDFATNQQQRSVHPRGYTFYVNLPDQKHRYFVTDSLMVGDIRGVLITKILFAQHTQVIQTLRCLRQQATYNALVSSCVRKTSEGDEDDEEEVFEVTAYHHCRMTVLFEHPAKDGMACVEFDTTEPSNPKCKLYQREGEEPFCSDEYATKVLQKCLSIPITMRAILKKTAGWLEMRKQKEAPAAATPAVGPPTFPSQNLPSSGPFSTLQKLNNSFGGSTGPSFNTGRIKERSLSNVPNVQGNILNDLSSTFANFFPQSQAQPSYSSTVEPPQPQTTVTTASDPVSIACKQTQNPMLASLLQSTIHGGGPPATRLPVQQVPKEPVRTHHPPPLPPPPTTTTAQPQKHTKNPMLLNLLPTTTTAQPQKHTKNPMLLNLLQEPNIDASLATSLQGKTVKKRKRKLNDKSPKQFSEEEPGSAGQVGSGSQDVFMFPGISKLSSMPLLNESTKSPQRQSSTSSDTMKSPFDPTKSNAALNDLCALLNKPVDQNKPQKKKQGRSDSVSSLSSVGAAAPSPRQSPKTPLSPAATTPRPSRSISSPPELSAPSPSNVLPGMITEMLPKSDPLPAIDPTHALSPDFPVSQKSLTTPSHQLPIDPFDFTEEIIVKNFPNFEMFVKTDPDEFGLPNVSSAIAKLVSASNLDTEDDKTPNLDVSSLLTLASGPSKPSPVGSRSQSFDLKSPGTPSLRSFGEVALDLTKTESLKPQSGNTTPSGKELRSSISSPLTPVQGSMPSPTIMKKAVSKAHTSKGKPKNFTLEGAGPFQTDVIKKNRKRYKKTVKEPGGQGETGSKKGRKKGRRPKYPDSSPECSTGEDYETSVRSEQPLKMTIKIKPISETKPKMKIAAPPPPPKIKVKISASDPSSSHSGSLKEDVVETNLKGPNVATTTKPVHQRRDSDEAKKDKGEVKQGEKLSKRESIEGARTDVTDRGIVRRLSESQKISGERKADERPTLKSSQSSLGRLKTTSGSPKLSKMRDGVKRLSHGAGPKGDSQKKSTVEILNSVFPRSSVADYKIPKLNKSGGPKTAKTGPEGDSGNPPIDASKKSGQSLTLTKSTEQAKLSSPLRNSNPAVQRPRSASPSMRQDPAKRLEAGNRSFTKPTPSQKVGSVSPRGSVSPQSSFSNKSRTSTERSSRSDTPSPLGSGTSPSHKLSSASQLKTPSMSSSSPSHPKSGFSSTGQVKSTQASSSPVHPSKSLSTSSPTSKGSGSSTTSSHTKSGINVSATTKTGSSPSHHPKAVTMVVSSANHPVKSPSVTSSVLKPSAPVSQAKMTQSSKASTPVIAGPGKSASRPPPLVITTSTRTQTPRTATPSATTPRTPAATTPSSAGPRLRSPPPNKSIRKTTSLSAIVSKLAERVQEKDKPTERLPGEEPVTPGEKPEKEEPKKLEFDQGDNDKVVTVLINSGLVEKAPVVTAKNSVTKASSSNKPTGKDDSAKAALAARQATDAKTGLPNPKSIPVSQTKSAVAQALKNISQAAKATSTPSSKPSPSPSTISKSSTVTPAKNSASVKTSAASSKVTQVKVVPSPSDKGSGNVTGKSGAVTSSSKTTTQSKVNSPSVKTSVGTAPSKTSGGPPRPKIIIPSQTRGSSQSSPVKTPTKTSQSPSSHRPIILSRSSSTLTSPDKGATTVTRVQIAPLSSPGATASNPSGGKQSVKGQSPSSTSKTKPEKNDNKKELDSKKNTQPISSESKDSSSGAIKGTSEKTNPLWDKGGNNGSGESLSTAEKVTTVPSKVTESKESRPSKNGDKNRNKVEHRKDDGKQTPVKTEVKASQPEVGASMTTSVSKAGGAQKSNKKDEAGPKSDKKEEKRSLKANQDSAVPKQSLKRTANREGGDEVPAKTVKTSPSAESYLVQAPDSTPKIIPLPTKSVNKPVTKTQTIKTAVQPTKAGNLVAKSPLASSVPSIPSIPSIPKDIDFKVPSPAMLPPSSPRSIIHGARSPGPSFKPSSPTKATSPVSPVPSPVAGIPATGGVPSPQGVKRAATPEESALPAKRSMLLESCSPVSPAESEDGLVMDVPASPSQRRQRMMADKASSKECGDVSNKGSMHVKSPHPRSPHAKSPSVVSKSPTGISVGSGDAGSPCTLDDDLMNEALSSVRDLPRD